MTRRLRIGVLGAAKIAGAFVKSVKASQRASVVAVASRDRARADAFAEAHDIPCASSYEALLADENVDAIYIPLPNDLHARWSIAAAQAGKHVLCEKPLAMNEAEAQAMFSAADANRVFLLEGLPYLFQPEILEIERRIAAREIGDVRTMFAGFAFTQTEPGDIRRDPKRGGGALMDVGSYAVSFARQVFGRRPSRVSAVARWTAGADNVDETLAATLEYPGGGIAQILCSFATAVYRRATIAGSEGIIETEYQNHTSRSSAPSYRIKRGIDRQAVFENVPVPREDGFRLEVDAFAEMIERGDRDALEARRKASVDNAWTLAAILASARSASQR